MSDISARFLGLTLHGAAWVLWLLIALSVASLAIMLERWWYFRTHRPAPAAACQRSSFVRRGRIEEAAHEVLSARVEIRLFVRAPLEGLWAARVKPASGRQMAEVGWAARDPGQRFYWRIENRNPQRFVGRRRIHRAG